MAVAAGTLRVAEIHTPSGNWGTIGFPPGVPDVFLQLLGWGSLMVITEVEKSSRAVMEQMFYAKLGPTPSFPSSPTAQTEQGKPTK
jgi:hypothetical protein